MKWLKLIALSILISLVLQIIRVMILLNQGGADVESEIYTGLMLTIAWWGITGLMISTVTGFIIASFKARGGWIIGGLTGAMLYFVIYFVTNNAFFTDIIRSWINDYYYQSFLVSSIVINGASRFLFPLRVNTPQLAARC